MDSTVVQINKDDAIIMFGAHVSYMWIYTCILLNSASMSATYNYTFASFIHAVAVTSIFTIVPVILLSALLHNVGEGFKIIQGDVPSPSPPQGDTSTPLAPSPSGGLNVPLAPSPSNLLGGCGRFGADHQYDTDSDEDSVVDEMKTVGGGTGGGTGLLPASDESVQLQGDTHECPSEVDHGIATPPLEREELERDAFCPAAEDIKEVINSHISSILDKLDARMNELRSSTPLEDVTSSA